MGSGVNLLNRLANNSVVESTGGKGYALFTDPVLERVEVSKDELFKRCETYEHLGNLDIYCMNIHVRYETMKAS